MGATDRFRARFGKTEVLDLAFPDQFLDRAGHVFDRHVRVDPVLIKQVDGTHLEPLERALDGRLDVFRPAIQAGRTLHPAGIEFRIEVEPELGGDHHLVAEGSEGFAHKFFVQVRAVDLGGVEEGDAAFHRGPEQRDHLALVGSPAVGMAHSHAAKAESRNFQAAVSQFSFLHFQLLPPA